MPTRLRHFTEYAAVRLIHGLLASLPFTWSMRLGEGIGGLWRLIDRRHRERVETQAMRVLNLDRKEANRFARKNFRHYGLSLAEFCRLGAMRKEDIAGRVDLAGFDVLCRDLAAEGKGLVIVTAHLGNWEWGNSIATNLGLEGGSIARPLDNPRVNEFVRTIREHNGFRILDKRGAIRGALKYLKQGQVVAVLFDQDAGPNGLMSPFLGETASTVTIPVELAIRVGSPMVVAATMRRDDLPGHFILRYSAKTLRPVANADPERETRRLVNSLNQELGELIRMYPEQWFWAHRRWKSRDGKQ